MASSPSKPREPRKRRGRPPGARTGSSTMRRTNKKREAPVEHATESPRKRRKYLPGGPGGGGRFVESFENEAAANTKATTAATAPQPRTTVTRTAHRTMHETPCIPRRERSTRVRTAVNRDELEDEARHGSTAAAAAAAVAQGDSYKPREERGWEEFHPHLDIEAIFPIFRATDVDGTTKSSASPGHQDSGSLNDVSTPVKEVHGDPMDVTNIHGTAPLDTPGVNETPSRRRTNRPFRDSVSLYANRHAEPVLPKTLKPLPISGQTPKERLDLKLPQYRRTDRIALFESKTFGQARYVDKSMMNAGYQESDNYIRPEHWLIKSIDTNNDDEFDQSAPTKGEVEAAQHASQSIGRVEYDMDEQDDMWLETLNTQRKANELESITREMLEITITKIEKEWHALEKRIPKPNPKPPQTHRPRSSSAAAVNGEPQAGEEQDSKCAICDDGDCENTNAIVFCDGCDLAVHQECYGVPFIPEGQWLCRKCQLIGRGIPTCIFCPNTDGAFKQTTSSKWAHLLCAMWIPEVSLGNHTFMEPVMEVDKVPRTRWKLLCYICNQRMGACIQCSNKNCYQAFHVSCARRCRLYLKIKNSHGQLAVLDGSMPLRAYCDKHCPPEHAEEHGVAAATKDARKFYKRAMKDRIWADSQASALQLAASHRHAFPEQSADDLQMSGLSPLAGDKKKGKPVKGVWKLPSGAPVIPLAVYDIVESSLARFSIRKRKDFVAEACRYWTLKREARRGAALLKRLQLQMETFSSMELTRRDFAAMGPSGKARLKRRIEFARTLIEDLERLQSMSKDTVERERIKCELGDMEQDFVDTCYFPLQRLLLPVVEKSLGYDKINVFKSGLVKLQERLDNRYYTNTFGFAHDLCDVINVGINTEWHPDGHDDHGSETVEKANIYCKAHERKRLGKRILKYAQPLLEAALKAETDITNKSFETFAKELDGMIMASLEIRRPPSLVNEKPGKGPGPEQAEDVEMEDAQVDPQIIVARPLGANTTAEGDAANDPDAGGDPGGGAEDDKEVVDNIDVGGGPGAAHKDTIIVDASESQNANTMAESNGAESNSATTLAGGVAGNAAERKPSHLLGGNTAPGSPPPSVNGLLPAASENENSRRQPPEHQDSSDPQSGPLTPPQSNGSFGHHGGRDGGPSDMLSKGGVPWYLNNYEIRGTILIEEQWPGREVLRCLSEELTDIDENDLNDLEKDTMDDIVDEKVVETTTTTVGKPAAVAAGSTTVSRRTSAVSASGILGSGLAMMTRSTAQKANSMGPPRKSSRASARRR